MGRAIRTTKVKIISPTGTNGPHINLPRKGALGSLGHCVLRSRLCWANRGHLKQRAGVAPLMAGQPPVVVPVRQVDSQHHRPCPMALTALCTSAADSSNYFLAPRLRVKLLHPKFHREDSALRSQAAGGVGVCASVAPPAFGCRLG